MPPVTLLGSQFDPSPFLSDSDSTGSDNETAEEVCCTDLPTVLSSLKLAVPLQSGEQLEADDSEMEAESEDEEDTRMAIDEWLGMHGIAELAKVMQQHLVETVHDLLFLCQTERAVGRLGLEEGLAASLWASLASMILLEAPRTGLSTDETAAGLAEVDGVGPWEEPELEEADAETPVVIKRSKFARRGGSSKAKKKKAAPLPKQLSAAEERVEKAMKKNRAVEEVAAAKRKGRNSPRAGAEGLANKVESGPSHPSRVLSPKPKKSKARLAAAGRGAGLPGKVPTRKPSAATPKLLPKKPLIIAKPQRQELEIEKPKPTRLIRPPKPPPPLAPMLASLLAAHQLHELGRPLFDQFGVVSVADFAQLEPADASQLGKGSRKVSKKQLEGFAALLASLRGPEEQTMHNGGQQQLVHSSSASTQWGAVASWQTTSVSTLGPARDGGVGPSLSEELEALLAEHKFKSYVGVRHKQLQCS